MSIYKKFAIGSAGTEYLRVCLEGGLGVCKDFLKQVDLKNGEIHTFLPASVPVELLERFRFGGVADAAESMSCLVAEIQRFLEGDMQGVVIFEDAMASKGDPILANLGTRMCFHGDEVYHYLLHDDLDPERIAWTVRQAASLHRSIGVMTTMPGRLPESIDDQAVKRLAEMTVGLVAGAYDQEGYIVWRRRPKMWTQQSE